MCSYDEDKNNYRASILTHVCDVRVIKREKRPGRLFLKRFIFSNLHTRAHSESQNVASAYTKEYRKVDYSMEEERERERNRERAGKGARPSTNGRVAAFS